MCTARFFALVCVFAIAACGGSDGDSSGTTASDTRMPTSATTTVTPTPSTTPTPGLMARGARIFFQETFAGNGRTCGTCHPSEAHFTLSPAFIAALPANDPLFVAERNAELATLENPDLMRSRALILENVDGFDQPPVFRGVPHIFNLAFTTPFGWSGQTADLREFAVRAVVQHFPRTLNRVAGVDFRLPTEDELDALVAFMLSVSVPADQNFDLAPLVATPAQRRGNALFFGNGKCGACHNGPLLGGTGALFNTGVVNLPVNTTPPRECDPPCLPLGPLEVGGARLFDVPPLFGVENTAPFFHDNSAPTLRDAVAFYTSPAFNGSFEGQILGGIQLSAAEIDDVTAFLDALTTCGNGVTDHGEPCDDGCQ